MKLGKAGRNPALIVFYPKRHVNYDIKSYKAINTKIVTNVLEVFW